MFRLLSALCLTVVVGCAGKPRAPAEAAAARPARIKDSPPESRAALRAADPKVGAEADEQRWGIEAAREQKQRTDQKNRAAAAPAAPPRRPPSGPFDVRAAPTPPRPPNKQP
jgi:hypothetical protein